MEGSVSGNGCRPSIHAIMFGEAASLAKLIRVVLANGYTTVIRKPPALGTNEYFRGNPWSKRNGASVMAEKEYLKDVLAEIEEAARGIRSAFLSTFWNEKLKFFSVYKVLSDCSNSRETDDTIAPTTTCSKSRHSQVCGNQVQIRIKNSTFEFRPGKMFSETALL